MALNPAHCKVLMNDGHTYVGYISSDGKAITVYTDELDDAMCVGWFQLIDGELHDVLGTSGTVVKVGEISK